MTRSIRWPVLTALLAAAAPLTGGSFLVGLFDPFPVDNAGPQYDVAYNADDDEYLVVYTTDQGGTARLMCQRIDATTMQMIGSATQVATRSEAWTSAYGDGFSCPTVEYAPGTGRYMLTFTWRWYQGGSWVYAKF